MPGKRLRKSNIDRFNGRPGGTGLDQQNQLHHSLSGNGHGPEDAAPNTTPPSDLTGAFESIATLAAAQGLAVVRISVAGLAPHPMNNPERSLPQPGNTKWDDLVESVKENGVRLPGLAVTKDAFIAARPRFADKFDDSVTHVAVYGHRRRAASLEAAQPTMPMIIDNSILENGGDLDAMTWENWGREDLDPVALAQQFALYSEEFGLGQRGIATRLGISQPTVSRHLALMLLVDEAHAMLRKKRLSLVAAADLSSKLPFGPRRRWQDAKADVAPDPDQDTPERAADQRAALVLIESGSTVELAASRVVAERRARATAASLGIEIVDPAEKFGDSSEQHRLPALPEDRSAASIVAAVDPYTASLAFYAEEIAPPPNGPSPVEPASAPSTREPRTGGEEDNKNSNDEKGRAEAQKIRRRVAAQLAVKGASRERLGAWLTAQFRWRVRASDNPRAWSMAFRWLTDASAVTAESVDSWQKAVEAEVEPKVSQRAIWAVAMAASELRASDRNHRWDGGDVAYLEVLRESEGFTPTEWEAQQVRSVQAS
ncbi:ParB/RepB/Spo0J family partition protein [Nocardia sp. NPDC055029]